LAREPREPRGRVRVCFVIRVRDGKRNIEPRGTSGESNGRATADHIRKRNTALPLFVFAEDRRGRSSIQLERRQEDHVRRRHGSTRRQWLQEADGISCTRISVKQVTMHRRSATPMSSCKLDAARRHREPSRRGGMRRGAIASLSLTARDRERAGTRRDFGWTRIDRAIEGTRDARFRCPITRHGRTGTERRGTVVVRHGVVASRRVSFRNCSAERRSVVAPVRFPLVTFARDFEGLRINPRRRRESACTVMLLPERRWSPAPCKYAAAESRLEKSAAAATAAAVAAAVIDAASRRFAPAELARIAGHAVPIR